MADAPKKVDELRKDPKIMAAYLAHAKKSLFLNEVMFYVNKGNNYKTIYTKYLYSKSKDQVNVNGKVYKAADQLASQADWENNAWPKIIAAGKKEVQKALDGGVFAFTKSKFYTDVLLKSKMGDPTKAREQLGWQATTTLDEMVEEM
ncbi:MAG: GDP-mannose 4,6-dehydratase, partial [Rhodobacteraceae bacterium]|nr:GDP-mannose 4,6-dehydratase [Paracoccaceae bacterium]